MIEPSSDCSELYQPLRADTLNDPYPTFQLLLREAPIFWHEDLFAWVLSRHRDCLHVLVDPETFTRDRRKLGRPVPVEGMTIQSLDPPDQLPLRRAILRAIRHTDYEGVSNRACDELEFQLSRQPIGRQFDFKSAVAAPAALRFACDLVGMSNLTVENYYPMFLSLTRSMDSALESSRYDEGIAATNQLNEYIDDAMASTKAGSVIHNLLSVPEVLEMPKAYVRNTISACFNAAYSTAYSTMSSFLLLVLNRPELIDQILEAENTNVCVQELLRFICPAQSTRRYATRDIVIDGFKIRQNDPIFTLMAAANRDPDVFNCPNEIDFQRSHNLHLAFGLGPHHCVGATPAGAFLLAYVERLVDWGLDFALAGEPSWLDTFTLRCLDTLPLVRKRDSASVRNDSR